VAFDLSAATLRANPNYDLIAYKRLQLGAKREFEKLARREAFYGVLWPRLEGLSLKAVSRQTAALFREMRRPSRLRDLRSAREQSVGDVAGLVLKDVLEVEVGGEFVSGAEAYPVIKSEINAVTSSGVLGRLSLEALQYASQLSHATIDELSARLYFYNRMPASERWRRDFANLGAIRALLGFARGMPSVLKDYETNMAEDESTFGWWYWKSWSGRPVHSPQASFKLYVSPHCAEIEFAFREIVSVLAERNVPAFKMGCDVHGLLRPDKLVAYFHSFDPLQDAAREIAARLSGCPAQGVPFSCALTESGLLSWGVDPPDTEQVMQSRSQGSWRLWITNRLASFLKRAARCSDKFDPIEFALARLQGEGVDIRRWAVDPDKWATGESV
jgi:hypothetical protein